MARPQPYMTTLQDGNGNAITGIFQIGAMSQAGINAYEPTVIEPDGESKVRKVTASCWAEVYVGTRAVMVLAPGETVMIHVPRSGSSQMAQMSAKALTMDNKGCPVLPKAQVDERGKRLPPPVVGHVWVTDLW